MKLIAHRGNTTGPNPLEENKPEYIEKAISDGYDVEIDLWYRDQFFYLGHDEPQYQITALWLCKNKEYLWIHCKNYDALEKISNSPIEYNFFWHEVDKFTLTSEGYIWTYPGQPSNKNSVIVMPETNKDGIMSVSNYECYAICSDYVRKIK